MNPQTFPPSVDDIEEDNPRQEPVGRQMSRSGDIKLYGRAAVDAVSLLLANENMPPREAWDEAIQVIRGECLKKPRVVSLRDVFRKPKSKIGTERSSKDDGCPKCAFLGLCQDGMINGVKPGKYTRSVKNKKYAIKAVKLLRKDDKLRHDSIALWRKVTREQSHDGQMHVVTALWNEDLIKR
jgi:hypothetical protein